MALHALDNWLLGPPMCWAMATARSVKKAILDKPPLPEAIKKEVQNDVLGPGPSIVHVQVYVSSNMHMCIIDLTFGHKGSDRLCK